MARLNSDQWRELRAEWEADPRQGLTWLVVAGGGRWDVTEEAVRLRRKAERWQKRGTLGSVVEKAHLAADAAPPAPNPDLPNLGDELGGSNSSPRMGGPEGPHDAELGVGEVVQSARIEADAVQLRTELIERHRNEWRAARALLYRSMKLAKSASGFEAAKHSKIAAETMAVIQAGERKAWGLDAANMPLKDLSDEDLERIASGRMPV